MNTVEADQITEQYLAEQKRANEVLLFKLRKNLETFTVKELRKEVIKMKADVFAVTKMKRDQLINLILTHHLLFPHLSTETGTKRDPTKVTTRRRRPPTTQPKAPKLVQTGIPPMSIKLTPELQAILDAQKQPQCGQFIIFLNFLPLFKTFIMQFIKLFC